MIFDCFDRISIVNLPERRDRRAEMDRELARAGLADDSRVHYFTALRFAEAGHFYAAGARGCFASHMAILENACARGQSILIIEDDCDFATDIRTRAVPRDWDIFYGGVQWARDPENLQQSDIVGSHFMGFSARTVQRLSPWLQEAFAGEDPAPIDGEYVRFRRANPDLVSVFATPPIAFQRPSRTDIGEQSLFDRAVGLRNAMAAARKVKRMWRRR